MFILFVFLFPQYIKLNSELPLFQLFTFNGTKSSVFIYLNLPFVAWIIILNHPFRYSAAATTSNADAVGQSVHPQGGSNVPFQFLEGVFQSGRHIDVGCEKKIGRQQTLWEWKLWIWKEIGWHVVSKVKTSSLNNQ